MNKLKNVPVSLVATVAILLFLIVLMNSAQATLGRYMSSFGGELGLSFNSKYTPEFACGEWTLSEDQQTLSINFTSSDSNTNLTRNSSVRIRLYIPETDGLSDVRMDMDSQNYTAEISDVPVGTAVYNLYGDGSICRFYGADGKELSFDLSNSDIDNLNATLTLVSDTEIDTSRVEIIVEPIKSQEIGGNEA